VPTFDELLQQARRRVDEVTVAEATPVVEQPGQTRLIDVREKNEWDEGHIPGAVHVPRGYLEQRIEQAVPDRSTPVLLYCAGGVRSVFAARTLQEMGYKNVQSLSGGYTAWKDSGQRFVVPRTLTPEQMHRYSRHVLIPEVGEEGQLKLLDAKVLLIGAGGLGSPSALYLAAAGVGTLGLVDADVVDESNLQRQIIHTTDRVGVPKVESARQAITALNPQIDVIGFETRMTPENAEEIIRPFDIVVDGSDNFDTMYLVNDVCVRLNKPNISASILAFDGQITTHVPHEGPCYRCVYPEAPPPALAPSCSEIGVLGVLPGIMGLLQANEVIKLILGIGEPLVGRLLMFDALSTSFTELKLRKNLDCPVCGEGAGAAAAQTATREPVAIG
jgi:molybdopterin/thiamine biosynthesis adenylyltransferase/rhodanese-related sulfurtransferase